MIGRFVGSVPDLVVARTRDTVDVVGGTLGAATGVVSQARRRAAQVGDLLDRLGPILDTLTVLLDYAEQIAKNSEGIDRNSRGIDYAASGINSHIAAISQHVIGIDSSAERIAVHSGVIADALPSIERLAQVLEPLEGAVDRLGRLTDRFPAKRRTQS